MGNDQRAELFVSAYRRTAQFSVVSSSHHSGVHAVDRPLTAERCAQLTGSDGEVIAVGGWSERRRCEISLGLPSSVPEAVSGRLGLSVVITAQFADSLLTSLPVLSWIFEATADALRIEAGEDWFTRRTANIITSRLQRGDSLESPLIAGRLSFVAGALNAVAGVGVHSTANPRASWGPSAPMLDDVQARLHVLQTGMLRSRRIQVAHRFTGAEATPQVAGALIHRSQLLISEILH